MFKVILAVVTISTIGVSCAGDSNESRLGSADFHASAEQPTGWRGDGTGRFPGRQSAAEVGPYLRNNERIARPGRKTERRSTGRRQAR